MSRLGFWNRVALAVREGQFLRSIVGAIKGRIEYRYRLLAREVNRYRYAPTLAGKVRLFLEGRRFLRRHKRFLREIEKCSREDYRKAIEQSRRR